MLVLSRKAGQEIVVGDNVRITVTKVSANRVTLGIDAPDHVRILRGEIEPIACSFEDEEVNASETPNQGVPMVQSTDESVIPFVSHVAR